MSVKNKQNSSDNFLVKAEFLTARPPARYGDHISHSLNPFKPEFIIVIFIHYKPWIAVPIFDL